MRVALASHKSVSIAVHGEEARVVAIAFLPQDLQGPFAATHYGEVRRTITDDSPARYVLESALRATNGFTELVSIQGSNALVVRAVRRNLVTGLRDLLHQLRSAFRYPTENEKRGM